MAIKYVVMGSRNQSSTSRDGFKSFSSAYELANLRTCELGAWWMCAGDVDWRLSGKTYSEEGGV